MSPLRRYPLFAAALLVCGLLAVGEGWCIYERCTAARAAAKRLLEKRAQLGEMSTKAPAPTREVQQAIAADLARAQQALAAMQTELKGRGPAAERMQKAKVPTARTDAYFDLATFVEKTRALARKNDVDVRPEAARFGFALHANEAPEPERIEAVFRQRQVVQYLMESLIDAHPKALLSVKREWPLTKKERADRAAAAAALANGTATEPLPEPPTNDAPDFFTLDPQMSVRAPGFLDTTGFRIVFIGETGSLRALLNKLATFELPVLVREVEVDPATVEEANVVTQSDDAAPAEPAPPPPASVVLTINGSAAPKPAARPPASTAAPIVAKPFSRFTVTVEYVELVPPPDSAAPPPS